MSVRNVRKHGSIMKMTKEVKYKQGMTHVWTDGEKIVITNTSGMKHVATNVDNIFGLGEWQKIHRVMYMEQNPGPRNVNYEVKTYECVSGYIPQRAIDDIAAIPDEAEDELPEDVQKENALEAIRNV